ncbi:hypothetical protein [Luteipulveratus mongoliensis]|uniref:Uncharacterized protein n=1 Tax=Luteipulveratus mongoliensis TaxID=571913 RepID=A0A0K1JJF6_9MICO|nr:hypothetical protein [Luteipulveratus mongoliensis]AKU16841.1 hypothetical protein VV02_14805 [Luteipulveratus mongoliensis]
MSTLPASVRLSLWVTSAYAGHLDLDDAVSHALPDVDHVTGALDRLRLWQDLGERVLCVALPRPGQIATLPRGNPELVGAATTSGECVFVPAIGGALVPTIEEFGPEGDTGTQVTLTAYDADPVPTHLLASMDESDIERTLREHLIDATQELDALDAKPWAGSPLRAMADDRTAMREWGLPQGLPGRALRIIQLAGTVAAACELGMEHSHATDISSETRRHRLLLDLLGGAETALAGATTAAAQSLAGLRPARP